jgi:hypothetical protein
MKPLVRRLERIASAIPPAPRPDPALDDEIMRLALARLSEEDIALCMGLVHRNDLALTGFTDRENKARSAFVSALTIEAKRAGYSSFEQFRASYCWNPRTSPALLRGFKHKR